jgi:hypothetical protein
MQGREMRGEREGRPRRAGGPKGWGGIRSDAGEDDCEDEARDHDEAGDDLGERSEASEEDRSAEALWPKGNRDDLVGEVDAYGCDPTPVNPSVRVVPPQRRQDPGLPLRRRGRGDVLPSDDGGAR